MANHKNTQSNLVKSNEDQLIINTVERGMPEFLQYLVIEHTEVYEALSEQFMVLSGLMSIKKIEADSAEQRHQKRFAYFKSISDPSLLNSIGFMAYHLQQTYKDLQETLVPNTAKQQYVDINHYLWQGLEFLNHVEMCLAINTLGLPENERPEYAFNGNCIEARNNVLDKLTISSHNSADGGVESFEAFTSITLNDLKENLINAAFCYVMSADINDSTEDSAQSKKTVLSSILNIPSNLIEKTRGLLLPNEYFKISLDLANLQYQDSATSSDYQNLPASSKAAVRICIAVYLTHPKIFIEFGEAHPDSALVNFCADYLTDLKSKLNELAVTPDNKCQVNLPAIDYTSCYKDLAKLGQEGFLCQFSVNELNNNSTLFRETLNFETLQRNINYLFDREACIEFNAFHFVSVMMLNLFKFKSELFVTLQRTTKISIQQCVNLALGNALVILEQPSDYNIFLKSSFESKCNSIIFPPEKDNQMQRHLLNQRDCKPSLHELQKNYNKLGFTDAPHNASEIINEYLNARSRIANEAEFHRAYMKLFTLDWSLLCPLFTSDEAKEPTTKKKSKTISLYESTLDSLKIEDLSQFELVGCKKSLSTLENNQQLKELLQNISSNGTVNKKAETEDKEDMISFFQSIEEHLEKHSPSLLKAWRKALYNQKTEGKDFLDILYQTLTIVAYASSSKPTLSLELTNKKLAYLSLPENKLKFQIFNMLYGSTLRQLSSIIDLKFINRSTQRCWTFNPESTVPEENVAFPLINFDAFCNSQSLKKETGSTYKNFDELEFKLSVNNAEGDKSIYLLCWIMPKENSCALSAVKTLSQLVVKIDSNQALQSAKTETDASINDDENEVELTETVNKHDFNPWQTISALCNTQAQCWQDLFDQLYIDNVASNEIIELTKDWLTKDCSTAKAKSNQDQSNNYSFVSYQDLSYHADNEHSQTTHLGNIYKILDEQVQKNPNDVLVSQISQAIVTFTPLYVRCIYALYNGLLCSELVDPCIHAYCYILQELKSLQIKKKYLQFATNIQICLMNLGVAASPFKDTSLPQAVLLPWNVMQMHAAMLKQQNSVHNISALLKELQAAKLIKEEVLIKNHRELLEHSYAPVLGVYPIKSTSNQLRNLNDFTLIVQEQTLNYGCALMLPMSNKTLFKNIQNKSQDGASVLCDELERHYLSYFVPNKTELNILLYQCPSLDIVKGFFKNLLDKTQTKDLSKEKDSQLKGLNINLYVVYHDDNQATNNLLEQVYQSMCSYLDNDTVQTDLQLANSNEFKQNVQLFVMSENQVKDKCSNLKKVNGMDSTITNSSSLNKFFDIALLFDISSAQYDKNNAPHQNWVDTQQSLPKIEAIAPEDLSKFAAVKAPQAALSDDDAKDYSALSVANAMDYMPNLTSSLYLYESPQNGNLNFINSLVPHSASTALKLYLSSLSRLNNKRIDNACIPYLQINDENKLNNLLSFAHTYSKMVLCIDNHITKSTLQSCISDKKQEHTLIFYQYNSKYHRNILISALFQSIEPLQEKILLDSITKECGAEFDTPNVLLTSIVKRATALSGRILARAQNSKNSSRELIGIVCSSFILENLQQKLAHLLEKNDNSGNSDNFGVLADLLSNTAVLHDDRTWVKLFNAQLSLDEHLHGLYQNSSRHADIIGVSAFYNEDKDEPLYKLYLYVAESKFRSQQPDYAQATEQLSETCEPLNLLFYKDKPQNTKNEQAEAQQGEQTSSNQSILKNMVLAWVHNTVIKAYEAYHMQASLDDCYPDNIANINNLLSAILKDQVEIDVLSISFNFSLNSAGESVVEINQFNKHPAPFKDIKKYAIFKIIKKDLSQLLNKIEAQTNEADGARNIITLPKSLEKLINNTSSDKYKKDL